ncbi:MAG TPA: DUF4870 domain-containing protein [Candidatus Anammoximicrobium sp.]|nr:DUF4870 domain-containing protein [Candidatus Anammoximicrobium sp.]
MSDAPFGGKPSTGGTSDERMWGMLCHLSSLSGGVIPMGNIVGPLIVWLIKKEEYALVDDQGKEALNFQISIMIYTIVLALTIIGIPVAIAAMIFGLVMSVIAAVKANEGEYYRYPLTIRFVK